MTNSVAFANRGTIAISGETTPQVIKDVEITISAEHVPLYGWGSILRQGVAKHSLEVSVKIGYVKFEADKAEFPYNIYTTAGTLTDSNAVPLYTVVGVFTFEDGGQILRCTISDVYFPDMPLKASEGSWVRLDLAGEGSTILFANT
jgi:hypothetical protein